MTLGVEFGGRGAKLSAGIVQAVQYTGPFEVVGKTGLGSGALV